MQILQTLQFPSVGLVWEGDILDPIIHPHLTLFALSFNLFKVIICQYYLIGVNGRLAAPQRRITTAKHAKPGGSLELITSIH